METIQVMEAKQAVRQACKSKRAALSIADCESWTGPLMDNIINSPEYKQAQSIMAYLAMPKEANLDEVIRHALEHGKSIYVPVCIDKSSMIAARLTSLESVTSGILHIRIPCEPHEVIDPKDLDLILVPGAGFDRLGGRMGMGNGYYDRFLAGLSTRTFIGVCWSMQVLDTPIPMDKQDQRMSKIITEAGIIHCV